MTTNNTVRQEVEITDIRMRFGSMVLFMVKWAVASIPALIILAVLGALFWALAIGLFSSLLSPSRQQSPFKGDATPSSTSPSSASRSADEAAYLSKVVVRGVTVGKSALGETGVFGEVKNNGERTLKTIEVTIYCLGHEGKPIFEKTYDPVLVSEFGFSESSEPLKPSYSRKFGVKLDDAPSDWNKKVSVKVTRVEFQ